MYLIVFILLSLSSPPFIPFFTSLLLQQLPSYLFVCMYLFTFLYFLFCFCRRRASNFPSLTGCKSINKRCNVGTILPSDSGDTYFDSLCSESNALRAAVAKHRPVSCCPSANTRNKQKTGGRPATFHFSGICNIKLFGSCSDAAEQPGEYCQNLKTASSYSCISPLIRKSLQLTAEFLMNRSHHVFNMALEATPRRKGIQHRPSAFNSVSCLCLPLRSSYFCLPAESEGGVHNQIGAVRGRHFHQTFFLHPVVVFS